MPAPLQETLRKRLLNTLIELCNIPSPSFGEGPFARRLLSKIKKLPIPIQIHQTENSFIVIPKLAHLSNVNPKDIQHIALVGHLDVVPKHKLAFFKQGRIYGAGASDMKGGLAFMLVFLEHLATQALQTPYQLSFIFYQCEEVPDIRDNGLYKLIKAFPSYFKDLDLAIVAEPTDKTLQIGCVGSQHAQVLFKGKQAHSARPWNGANALSRASKFIHNISKIKPKRQRLWGVDFFDVLNITESQSEPGLTTLPSWWKANVNFRFSPRYTEQEAKRFLKSTLINLGVTSENFGQFKITSSAPAGKFHPTPLFKKLSQKLNVEILAKQAWTDVAQLGKLGISAFNYGPGLTAQCHRETEYAPLSDLVLYTQKLFNLLT